VSTAVFTETVATDERKESTVATIKTDAQITTKSATAAPVTPEARTATPKTVEPTTAPCAPGYKINREGICEGIDILLIHGH